MSDTTCGQLHQRPITSASNYNRITLPNQILFDHCTGYPKKSDKKCNNEITNIQNINNNPAWISTYLQSRRQRRLARTGYLWLPEPEPRPRVAELQPPSDGSGSVSVSPPRSITQILTTPVQSPNGKFIFLLLRMVCMCSQSSAYPSNPYPTNDLCVSKPGSKLGFIWCPFSFNVLKYVELFFNVKY